MSVVVDQDNDTRTNPEYAGLIRAWRDAFDGLIALYEYYRKYSWHALPLVELIGEELPLYDDAGIDGLGIYSVPADWLTYELVHSLTAEFAWTTDRDTDTYVLSYLDDRYEPVVDAVGTYLDCVETAGMARRSPGRGWLNSRDRLVTIEDLHERE